MRLEVLRSCLFSAALAGLLQALSGCAACDLVGCRSGLVVVVSGQGNLPAGAYAIHIEFGNESYSCRPEWGATGVMERICVGNNDDSTVLIDFSGPGEDGSGSMVVEVARSPTNVIVVVERDGDRVASFSGAPLYRDVYPSGESCGVGCRVGDVGLTVPGG